MGLKQVKPCGKCGRSGGAIRRSKVTAQGVEWEDRFVCQYCGFIDPVDRVVIADTKNGTLPDRVAEVRPFERYVGRVWFLPWTWGKENYLE